MTGPATTSLDDRYRAALTALHEQARIAAALRNERTGKGVTRYDLMAVQGDLQAYQPECERIARIAAHRHLAVSEMTEDELARLLSSTPLED